MNLFARSPHRPVLLLFALVLLCFSVASAREGNPGTVTPLPDREYYPRLIAMIRGAENEIRLSMYLFRTTTSPRNLATDVAEELIAASRRGVRVEVLLEISKQEERNRANRDTATLLRQNGIPVHFDSPVQTTHTKLVVIDQRFLFAGSHNLTHSALAGNHEFSLMVDNPTLARKALDYLDSLDGTGGDRTNKVLESSPLSD